MKINYSALGNAIQFYVASGYEYIDVPWIVGKDAYLATKPSDNRRDFKTFAGNLVASGEQSFLEMMINNNINKGRYICCTPCFRDELISDEMHLQYFMKVELIHIFPDQPYLDLIRMIKEAESWFNQFIQVKVIETDQGYDIVDDKLGYELGSYGNRKYALGGQEFKWIYGTGHAEPRFSLVNYRWSKDPAASQFIHSCRSNQDRR